MRSNPVPTAVPAEVCMKGDIALPNTSAFSNREVLVVGAEFPVAGGFCGEFGPVPLPPLLLELDVVLLVSKLAVGELGVGDEPSPSLRCVCCAAFSSASSRNCWRFSVSFSSSTGTRRSSRICRHESSFFVHSSSVGADPTMTR